MAADETREGGNVRALHPVRVLLAATDSRFLRTGRFLLERDGFEVVATCDPAEAAARAQATRPHLVVLDESGSRTAAGSAALALATAEPPVPVLVVAQNGAARPGTSFPEVITELERLYGCPRPRPG